MGGFLIAFVLGHDPSLWPSGTAPQPSVRAIIVLSGYARSVAIAVRIVNKLTRSESDRDCTHLQGWATNGTVTFSVKNESDGKTLALTFPFEEATSHEAAVQIAAQKLATVTAAFSQVASGILNKAESGT